MTTSNHMEKTTVYQSKDSSSNVKCNNININLNGFNNKILVHHQLCLSDLATEAQAADEGEVGANSLERWWKRW